MHWQSLDVHVRVDAEGALHIRERHAIVFDGAWNGGERTFALRSWHWLQLKSVAELHPNTVERTRLIAGDLDQVNEFRLTEGRILRWRSRLPTDPPFDKTLKVYEINYVLNGALLRLGDRYSLDHDLAFPDRTSTIERFEATIEFDPAWSAPEVPRSIRRDRLRPGDSAFITAEIDHIGAARPSLVGPEMGSATALPALRYALAAALVGFLLLSAYSWLRHERRLQRFEPLTPLSAIDEQWLNEHVFSLKPEVVGAAWDCETSEAEVAALIARLNLEGKLRSTVKQVGSGPFKRPVLHLELLCERTALVDYERTLIDRLFIGRSRHTDTDKIKYHYRRKGFSPARILERELPRHFPPHRGRAISSPRWRPRVTAALLLGALALLIAGVWSSPEMTAPFLFAAPVIFLLFVAGGAFARIYRNMRTGLTPALVLALVVPLATSIFALYVLLGGAVKLTTLHLLAAAFAAAGIVSSAFNCMLSRAAPESMRLRRELYVARKYFVRELASPNPRLRDEYFPYLIAFGLGPKVDRWFRSFGGASTTSVSDRSSSSADMFSTTATSGSSSASSWSGGGGAFGGAGATGYWAAAAAGLAAGVSPPASSSGSSSSGGSSSGGGGGGGGGSSGSSGGGGGGGW